MATAWRVLTVLAAVGAGCSTIVPVEFATDPRVVGLQAGAAPVDLAITVGMPTLPAKSADEARHAIELDARRLQGEVADVLRDAKVFRTLTTSATSDQADLLREGWDRRDDCVLEVTVNRADVTYEGTNGWFYPNLFFWWYAWAPAWWVADEVYAAHLDVTIRLVSVHSGREVWRHELRPTIRHDLNDFQRGWGLLATLFPGSLDAEDWRQVGELLLPSAWLEARVELLTGARRELPGRVAEPAFREAMAKTLVLAVGLTAHGDYGLHNLRFAAGDAAAAAQGVRAAAGVPEKNLLVLQDKQATGAGVRAAVRDFLVARSRPEDTLIVHLAGYGVVLPDGRPALVPYDFDPKRPAETALPLAELAQLLDGAPGRVVWVCDLGFGGGAEGRALPGGTLAEGALEALAGPRRLVCLAAGAGQGAYELPETEHGALTHFWLEGLAGAADTDQDGWCGAVEVADYAVARAGRQAALEGHDQEPRRVGDLPGLRLAARGKAGP